MKTNILNEAKRLFSQLDSLPFDDKVQVINQLRLELKKHSPFENEPVDCLQWVKLDHVVANDYNPNVVAPPEMELLKHSILADGYTQPIVAWETNGHYEVVDGFHRNRIGREDGEINKRINGYLPLTIINETREGRGDRISATIRHNRARGKHSIDGMAEIVLELKRRNWSDKKISKNLGMDADEVLRLSQITGLADMFANKEFSQAWEADTIDETDTLSIED
jgi:ParB-like chromosome segregation protein Spo0J